MPDEYGWPTEEELQLQKPAEPDPVPTDDRGWARRALDKLTETQSIPVSDLPWNQPSLLDRLAKTQGPTFLKRGDVRAAEEEARRTDPGPGGPPPDLEPALPAADEEPALPAADEGKRAAKQYLDNNTPQGLARQVLAKRGGGSKVPGMLKAERDRVQGSYAEQAGRVQSAGEAQLDAAHAEGEAAARTHEMMADAKEQYATKLGAMADMREANRQAREDLQAQWDEAQKAGRQDVAKAMERSGGEIAVNFLADVGAAVAMAMGAYGAAMGGTRNFAADIVQQSAKKRAQMYAQRVRNAKDKLAAGNERFQRMVALLGDEDAAILSMENALMREAAMQVDSMTSKGASEEALAKSEAIKADINARVAQNENALQQRLDDQAGKIAAQEIGLQAGRERAQAQAAAQANAAMAGQQAKMRDYAARGLAPLPGANPSDKEKEKAALAAAAGREMDNLVRRMEKIAIEAGRLGGAPGGGLRAKAEQLASQFVAAYNDGKSLGALDEGTIGIVKSISGGNAAGIDLLGNKPELLRNLRGSIGREMAGRLKAYGFGLAEPQQRREKYKPRSFAAR